jgi:Tfp pilus assembly protein PilO
MSVIDMDKARAWFSYAGLRLGRCGVAGLMLLFACAIVIGTQAMRSNADTLRQRIDQARADLKNAATAVKPVPTAQSFLAQLPAAEQVPQFIEGVHRLAQTAGVQIERAEYRAPVLASGQVLRSQVVLPLVGSYPGITRWLGQVLSQHPSAAIDELSLQRGTTATEPVRARVVLSHYSRVLP